MEPLSQVTCQFDLAVPGGESSEFCWREKEAAHQAIVKSIAFTYRRARRGRRLGGISSWFLYLFERIGRSQLEMGDEDRWRMWSSVVMAGVWRERGETRGKTTSRGGEEHV